MKLIAHLEENERGTPIEFANAVINRFIEHRERCYGDERDVLMAEQKLAEVAEHIQVYLKHSSIENEIGMRLMYGGEGRR